VFRGMAYWSAGQIAFSQDRPSDPAALFTNANVIEGNFNYEGSSLKARHTVALVTWNDPENAYEQKIEYVSDETAIAKYGIIEIRTAAFGCTSRGQANRVGRWLLYSEQNETSTVTFKVGLDGAIVRPGQIIKVMDSVRAGSRKAGRISAVSGTTVTIDSAITVATNDTITVVLPDGSVEQRTISADSTGTSITISSGFSQTVAAQTIFVIETSTLEAQLFRVLSVTEDGELYTIVGLEHNPAKYEAVEDGLVLQPREISTLNRTPDAPGGLDIDEQLVESGNSVTTEITVSWHNVIGATAYQVSYKTTDTAAYETIGDTTNNSIAFNTDQVGTFTFRVVAISPIGKRSNPAVVSAQIAGKTSLPGNVQNLSFEATNNNSGRLRWDGTVDLDVKVGGRVYIKHSNLTDGSATWSNSVDFVKAKAGSATEAIIPLVEGEILVKFADDGGRLSATETSVIITRPDTLGSQIVQSRREDADTPPFQGQKTSTFYSDEFDALTLDGTALFDPVADVDNIVNFDFFGNITSSGVYNFLNVLDLEATYSLDLERHFVTRGFYPASTVDARSENVDDWDEWDGDLADKVNAVLQVRTTTDDPNSSPTWGDWQEFVNGTFKARAYQFRANLTSSDVAQNILVDQLGYEATFQRRTENSTSTIASGAGAKAVTFANAFFAGTASLGGTNSSLPSVGISAQNMQSGDYFTLTNLSGIGFTVTFFNSSNVAVDRNFTYTAVGFGKAG
jgi:Phage-related protein, tail component